MSRTEQIQKNIEFLRSLQYWVQGGINDDMYGAYEIAIMYLEKKIEDTTPVNTPLQYPEGDNHIDMSGASDNGDR